jgi:hypothetical protein
VLISLPQSQQFLCEEPLPVLPFRSKLPMSGAVYSWLLLPLLADFPDETDSFKGIHREFRKLKGPGIHTYVRHTKIVQGLREFNASGLKEKATMLTRWKNLSAPLKRKGTR